MDSYLSSTENTSDVPVHLKHNFERANQKHQTSIHALQRKLLKYEQQVKLVEEGGVGGGSNKNIMKVSQVVILASISLWEQRGRKRPSFNRENRHQSFPWETHFALD